MLKKFLTIITALIVLTGCSNKEEAPKEVTVVPVLAVKPNIKDIPLYIDSIGVLQPSTFMEIRPQVNGSLKKVLVQEGDGVHEGTPLFIIDTRPYEVKVKQALAQQQINQITYSASQKKLQRYQSLAEKDLISKVEWEEMLANTTIAEATLKADDAQLEAAELELGYCTIRSPAEGRVGKLDARAGLLVFAGQPEPLATISNMNPLLVEFAVTEQEFQKLPKNNVEINLQPLYSSACSFNGKIHFLDNHFDPKTGMLLIRGKVDNPDYHLRPGQTLRIQVPIAIESNAKLIPQKAVKYNQQGPYVYVVQSDNTVGFRQITLGKEEGLEVVVTGGLDADEQVITDGHLRLSPGRKVEVKS